MINLMKCNNVLDWECQGMWFKLKLLYSIATLLGEVIQYI